MPKTKQKVPDSPEAKAKIKTVMEEFAKGDLKSSTGEKVTDRKQAIAIALSEARTVHKAEGGTTVVPALAPQLVEIPEDAGPETGAKLIRLGAEEVYSG